MKIVFVITDLGSFNNFLSELALELIKNPKIDLHVICSNYKVIDISDKNKFNSHNFHFHFLDIPRDVNIINQFKVAYIIRKKLDEIKPQLIHAHFTTGILPTILLKNSAYIYWGTFHGLGMNSTTGIRKFLFTIIEFFCFYRLNKIFVLNNEDNLLLDKLKISKKVKYSSKGIGCDINKFSTSMFNLSTTNKIKSELKISNQFIICFTGRFVDFKGFHLVIKSFLILADRFPAQFKLILLGGRDSIHSCGLSEKEKKMMISHQDIINIGYSSEVSKYLAVSNVFLFPSKKEGLPICILESLSMGVPVITMNSRGNNDLIKDGHNGFLIDSSLNIDNTILCIISYIEKLRYNNVLRTQLSENALKDREQFSRDRFIEEHKFLYSQLYL